MGLLVLALVLPAAAHATLEVPRLEGRVNDLAGLLPPERAESLANRLAGYESETGHQIVVLTVPSLEGEPIEQFALRVAETWKIGHAGLDNGAILVVVPEERAARIEVGYGLEGAVPDVVAKRILEDVMFPSFRTGRMAEGIETGVAALMEAARAEQVPPERDPRRRRARRPELPLSQVFFASILGSLFGGPMFASRRRRLAGVLAAGLVSGGITYLLVRALPWALVGFVLGALLVTLGAGSAGRPRRGGWIGYGGGFGGGVGGGFGGGGGGFGGGGASGRW